MIKIDIPNGPELNLTYLVLDLNGTLAVDGALLPGVAARIASLSERLEIFLLTANTHGGGAETARKLGIQFTQLAPGPGGAQKERFVQELGSEAVIAVGNGANDAPMLKTAALGIVVNGAEGAAPSAILSADIYAPNILDALDLLLHPDRLRATLRP
ncbi:MAG TPA: HAD family hydrolase [Caldilineae bacterium]|nr:HAD family hydrolase [Caldilineae bacterium]